MNLVGAAGRDFRCRSDAMILGGAANRDFDRPTERDFGWRSAFSAAINAVFTKPALAAEVSLSPKKPSLRAS
jgi:hypothetical protein